jgi:hypothetical protein
MASHDAENRVTPGLIMRLQDIPGVETVAIDLASESGVINLRVASDADEQQILERVQALLVAYGVDGLKQPNITVGRYKGSIEDLGIDVNIQSMERGARIEVRSGDITSARQVASSPMAIAQGLADAWCQVTGRPPREVSSVSISDSGELSVVISHGSEENKGVGDVSDGWANALTFAVGSALGFLGGFGANTARLAPTAW